MHAEGLPARVGGSGDAQHDKKVGDTGKYRGRISKSGVWMSARMVVVVETRV